MDIHLAGRLHIPEIVRLSLFSGEHQNAAMFG
jgi:hypothetical protein